MKFFTAEYLQTDHDDAEEIRLLTAAVQGYEQHLERMQGVLPDHIFALTRLKGMDDGLIAEVRHDWASRTLRLVMRCGDLIMGYYDLILRYEQAEISQQDEQTLTQIARTTKNDGRHRCDLYAHEVDITDTGMIEHRLLFHPGIWFAVGCRDLQWETVARANRKLPHLRKRYLRERKSDF